RSICPSGIGTAEISGGGGTSWAYALEQPRRESAITAASAAWRGAASAMFGKAGIFLLDEVFSVDAFQSTHGEMAARHVLEMFEEGVIDRGAAERADHREGLRRHLLRHHHAKARSHLREE